jgi:hypothetical protein
MAVSAVQGIQCVRALARLTQSWHIRNLLATECPVDLLILFGPRAVGPVAGRVFAPDPDTLLIPVEMRLHIG